MRARTITVLATAMAVLLTGCGGGSTDDGPPPDLRVLAGSELADLAPILDAAATDIGVRVRLDPVGSIDGAERVVSGQAQTDHDAIWLSSNRYLSLQNGGQAKLGTAVNVMSSPVALGLRRSVAQQLGWVGRPVTWSEIAAAAGQKRFTYGMTDPSASNSGFSTLVAVATALVGTGAALTAEQATSTSPALRDFFAAQTLSAGSSGFLQDAYLRRATGADPGAAVDGLVNYESVLLTLNAAGKLPEPLEIIRPADGVITADYPFTMLAGASDKARDAARKLTDYLRTPAVQQRIMEQTFRRPAVPGVALAPVFGGATLVELPFPTDAQVVDSLLTSWFDKVRRPSRTIYVLDTSGSMAQDDRIGQLKGSLAGLTGADESLVGKYRRFRGREEVTLLPFSSAPATPQTFTVAENDPGPDLQRIANTANGLRANGGTAIYDSLDTAYGIAAHQMAADPDRFTSIVLMTDGENTNGSDIGEFESRLGVRPPAERTIPVFCVLYGEGDNTEMVRIASLTGGKTFDARSAPLAEVFREIRGYV